MCKYKILLSLHVSSHFTDIGAPAVRIFINTYRNTKTFKAYTSGQKMFVEYCQPRMIDPNFPYPSDIANYLILRFQQGKAYKTLTANRSAIRDLHKFSNYIPSDSILVQATMSTIAGISDPSPIKPEFTDFHLHEIFKIIDLNSLTDVRDYTMILFQRKGIFRESEVAKLKRNLSSLEWDPESNCTFLKIELPNDSENSTKNKHSRTVLLAADSDNSYKCPVFFFTHYLHLLTLAGKFHESNQFLFPNLNSTSLGVSDSHINSALKRFCPKAGIGPFTSHCIRVGGASAALRSGIAPHLIKRQGGWLSEAFLIYIRDSIRDQLTVSLAI
jgi:site-specific recombinase XerD